MKRVIFGTILTGVGCWGQQAVDVQQSSIEKQRASVLKQVGSVTRSVPPPASSFFTVPWIDAPAKAAVPPCDPLPAEQLDKLIEQNSKAQDIGADLVRAVISQESGGRPCAVSSKGAQGLMQLMPVTAEQFGVRDPFDPAQNVEAGTKLLKQLLTKYSGDLKLALSAYNAGSGRVDRDGAVPPIQETMDYVESILSKLPKPQQPPQSPAK